ncbi:MAG: hypothetical protein HOE62_11560 [Alphaproteobacteria bacterium]|nr:hypothetical protein [Alphaproteobacteria bacterium]MBT4018577.1 hypothetical protein [Alphaproteobacteria bacterium]MBT5158349.1 hypothetical protein [Alphaproteobacteria bacterium]MBT5918916.1 hypothetical protein [Alphaproteobacteria bacterium]MBT6385852.1 hypothetical protein [Alphaproteobacteria bacterium]
MSETKEFPKGGYKYIKGLFQYSAGVAALPGYRIERVRFAKPMPLADGFKAIKAHLDNIGRPVAAFCACELRSPAPFDDQGFHDFNREYIKPLEDWGIVIGEDNPIARSNVCPKVNAPSEPGFYAFSYTVPDTDNEGDSFVIAGSAESPEGNKNYKDETVRYGEQTPDAMREKAQFVLAEMERRMTALGFGWAQTSAAQIYSVYDFHSFFEQELVERGAANGGVTWHYCRPPLDVLDYEMDVRGIAAEYVVNNAAAGGY